MPAVNLLNRLGRDKVYAFYQTLGLHHREHDADYFGPGLALGALPISLEQLVTAYTALVDGGRLHALRWYEGQPLPPARRVLSENAARLVTLYLSDPSARLPSFPRMGAAEYPYPVAMKTGTSAGYRDAWTVAWSMRYLVGVWVGHPDYRPMNHLSGYRTAAVLAHRVMDLLHPDLLDGQSEHAFPPPRGFVVRRLCPLSGKLATEACDPVVSEWMAPDEVPADHCPYHLRVAVDRRTHRVTTGTTPRRHLEMATVLNLPARYADWAVTAGLPLYVPPGARLDQIGRMGVAGSTPPGAVASRPVANPVVTPMSQGPAPRVRILYPRSGTRILSDPERPAGADVLTLRASSSEPVPELLWYVDGVPFQTAPYPYTVRWPIVPGEHVFVAEVPMTPIRSQPVRVILEGGPSAPCAGGSGAPAESP